MSQRVWRWSFLAATIGLGVGMAAVAFPVAQAPGDVWWPGYGNGADNSRYFASRQINKSNVNQLQVAWTYPYGETGSNPIVARGVDLRPRPQRIDRRGRREDRQGDLGPREHERHDAAAA